MRAIIRRLTSSRIAPSTIQLGARKLKKLAFAAALTPAAALVLSGGLAKGTQ